MRVLVTGGTGHIGAYLIPELIRAGHTVVGLARSDTSANTLTQLGASVHRGDISDLDSLKAAISSDIDGVIHLAHRQDLLPVGGIDAVAAAEVEVIRILGDALAGTDKPFVVSGSIGAPSNLGTSPGGNALGRPSTEADPALSSRDALKGSLRVRNAVEETVLALSKQGVRSSVIRISAIAHSPTDKAGFLPLIINLAKEKGIVGYPSEGKNVWTAVHAQDLAVLFRLALESGAPGRVWHGVEGPGTTFRQIAEVVGAKLGLPAVPIPEDALMLPGYYGFLANLVTLDLAASNDITRKELGWEPQQPDLLADLDNGPYFPSASDKTPAASSSIDKTDKASDTGEQKVEPMTITIIGSGGMASAIGTCAVAAGHTIQIAARDPSKAQALVDKLGQNASVGPYGAVPAGEIVILAVLYPSAAAVVETYGAALSDKILVDMTNPFSPDGLGLLAPPDSSAAQELAKVLPPSTRVIKAFNTIFGHVLRKGGELDAFFAGDDEHAKKLVKSFVRSIGLRPMDVGGLQLARWLEGLGVVMLGAAKNGAGTWNFAIKVDMS